MKNKKDFIFIVLIVMTIVMWSSAYSVIKICLEEFAPQSLALLRFLFASTTFLIIGLFCKFKMPDIKDIPLILLCGAFGYTIYHVALNIGETTVKAGTASIVLNCYPVFVALLSAGILHEKVNLKKWMGILISFAGVFTILLGENQAFGISMGLLLILLAAFSNSLYDVLQKGLLSKYSPVELTAYITWSGTLFLTIFSKGLIADLQTASLGTIGAAAYLGICSSAAGSMVWAWALSKNSVTNIASLQYMLPVCAVIMAFLLLGEIPGFIAFLGGLVIISGVIIVNLPDNLPVFDKLKGAAQALTNYFKNAKRYAPAFMYIKTNRRSSRRKIAQKQLLTR